VDTFDQRLVHLSDYCCTKLPKACNYEWDLWLGASSGSSAPPPPPRGSLYYQHLFCRTHFILPWTQGGPPSTSPTSVVAAAGLAASTPQGARNRHLLLRWWPLSDLPPAPPGGPPLMSPNSVVTATGPVDSIPQEARHRHLQLRWWSLPDLPPATPRGPAINVSNSGGGCCRTCRQHPLGGPPSTYR
jgi:hypothetical protein